MTTNLKTQQAGVIALINKDGDLEAIIYKDPRSRKNVFYRCQEMAFDELETLFKNDGIIAK